MWGDADEGKSQQHTVYGGKKTKNKMTNRLKFLPLQMAELWMMQI
jgi:hypothetical protein